LSDIESYAVLPVLVDAMSDIHVGEEGKEEGTYLRSKKWDENLCLFDDLWKYESDAKEREIYYQVNKLTTDKNRFDKWLDHKLSDEFLHGSTTGDTLTDVIEPIKKIGKNQIDFEAMTGMTEDSNQMTGMEGEGKLQLKDMGEEERRKAIESGQDAMKAMLIYDHNTKKQEEEEERKRLGEEIELRKTYPANVEGSDEFNEACEEARKEEKNNLPKNYYEVNEHMTKQGFIEWMGHSFIKQEWIDDRKPYDRMAITFQGALGMWENRHEASEWSGAIKTHKEEVKANNEEDDEYNF